MRSSTNTLRIITSGLSSDTSDDSEGDCTGSSCGTRSEDSEGSSELEYSDSSCSSCSSWSAAASGSVPESDMSCSPEGESSPSPRSTTSRDDEPNAVERVFFHGPHMYRCLRDRFAARVLDDVGYDYDVDSIPSLGSIFSKVKFESAVLAAQDNLGVSFETVLWAMTCIRVCLYDDVKVSIVPSEGQIRHASKRKRSPSMITATAINILDNYCGWRSGAHYEDDLNREETNLAVAHARGLIRGRRRGVVYNGPLWF
jgi:hypothetical protein